MLEWAAVPGAKHYELQVDDDVNFGSPDPSVPAKIFGTRFSPQTTFTNGQYYWRVRARDLDDNPTEWVRASADSHYFFDRVWRDAPELVYPYDASGDGAVQHVSNDLYYEWEPVPHASNYEVWLSTDANFTETHHRHRPVRGGRDDVHAGRAPRRVHAHDRGHRLLLEGPTDGPSRTRGNGVEGIFSATQRFVYTDQDFIAITTPAMGATVAVPTLDWSPVPGTETYEVELFQGATSRDKATTHSTSYTPLGLELDPTRRHPAALGDPCPRQGQADHASVAGRNFTWAPAQVDTSTPLELSSGPATYDAPSLSWGAVAGAEYYRIDIADAITGTPYADTVAPILVVQALLPRGDRHAREVPRRRATTCGG